MKDSGSGPPPAPDPTLTGQAQTASNIATAIANARLNRVNQQTPWGSITYTQGPADANGVPSYSSQINLSPAQQQMLEQQQVQQMMRGQIAHQILANSGGSLGQPLDLSGLPAITIPGVGGHPTTWSGNHPAPVGMAAPQLPAPSSSSAPPPSPTPVQITPAPMPAQSSGPGISTVPGASPGTFSFAQMLQPGTPNSTGAVPTYQDYLAANPQNNGGSEGGAGTFSGLSQDQWNALNDAGKWNNIGNMLAVAQSDPRFAALHQAVGGPADRPVLVGPNTSASVPFDSTHFNDPNAIQQGDGVFATSQGNLTPFSQMGNNGGLSDKGWALAALGALTGGAAVGAMSGAASPLSGVIGAGGTAAPVASSAPVDESAGLSMANPFTTGGPDYASELAAQGGNYAPVVDASSAASGYAPVTDLSTEAARQNIFGQMLDNYTQGRGLFGNLNPSMNRALLPMLIRALRQQPSTGTGGP
jgi:hypothetical protein